MIIYSINYKESVLSHLQCVFSAYKYTVDVTDMLFVI